MPVAPSLLSTFRPPLYLSLSFHVLAALSLRPLFARHPFTNVGGTMRDANALDFALHQESHGLHIDEADFNQIEDEVPTALLLDRSAELRELLGADAAAHGQGGSASVNG